MRAKRRAACVAAATIGLLLLVLVLPAAGHAQQPAKAVNPMTPSREQLIPIAAAGFDRGRPAGLFYRLKMNLTSGTLEVRTLLFLAGSRITRTFPFGGGEVFDQSRCNPDMCGSYEHDADQITVRWDNGQVERWPYKRTDEGFEVDGDNFKLARPLTEAALIGTWASAAGNVYKFDPDGTFSFGTGQGGVGGRYRVKGMTLALDFADGTQQRRTLFAAGSGEPIGLIGVEGDVYRRR